jgi:hypothetical protein
MVEHGSVSSTTNSRRAIWWASIIYVLFAGFILRFYQLDTPTLNADDFFILIPSSLSWEYLFDFLKEHSTATPLTYILTRLSLMLSHSDFSLRLLPALAGCLSIYLTYQIGKKHFTQSIALFSSCLVCTNELHLWCSRQARPYSFFIALALVAFHCLFSFVNNPSNKNLIRLAVVNFFLLSIHFLSLFIVQSQFIILIIFIFRDKEIRLKQIVLFCCAVTLSFLPNAYFLYFAVKNASNDTTSIHRSIEFFNEYMDILFSCIGLYEGKIFNYSLIAIAALGLAVAYKKHFKFFIISIVMILYPLAFVLITRVPVIVSPQHLSFLLFIFAFLISIAISMFINSNFLSISISLLFVSAFSYHILNNKHQEYYSTGSCLQWYNLGSHKTVARQVQAFARDGEVVGMDDPFYFETVNWYLDQFSNDNFIRRQHITPDQKIAVFNFFGNWTNTGVPEYDEAPLKSLESPDDVASIDSSRFFKWRIQRDPSQHIASLPYIKTFTAQPGDFYKNVSTAKDVFFLPPFEGQISPSVHDSPTSFEYCFVNDPGVAPKKFNIVLDYVDDAKRNRLRITSRFDQEPETTLLEEAGPSANHMQMLTISRDNPFSKLTLRFEMISASISAKHGVTNLQSIGFKKLDIYACDDATENACQLEIMTKHLPTDFPTGQPLPQEFVETEDSNLVSEASDHEPWQILTSKDKSTPGRFSVRMRNWKSPVVYLPRLCGTTSSFIITAKGDGRSQILFELRGPGKDCTPVGMCAVLPVVPDWAEELEVELIGGAQIWSKDRQIFFATR